MYLGTRVQYVVELLSGDTVTVMQPNLADSLPANAPVYISWSPTDCLALEK